MKKVLIILSLWLSLGCEKNKESVPGDLVLSKQFMNNILISERTYGADGKLAKEQNYNEQTGIFSYSTGFEYDSYGRLLNEKQYNASNKLSAIVSYYWFPNGRLEKHEYLIMSGADSGKITVRVRYGYDALGRISKQSWVDLLTDQVYDSREMKYYSNNNLRSVEGYSHYGGTAELKYRLEHSPEGDSLLPGFANRGGYIIDFRLPDFVTGETHYRYYDGALINTETKTIYTNRQYNERGYLKSQTTTTKKIKPAGADVVDEFRYEYFELNKP
jgi:hypothetical protein